MVTNRESWDNPEDMQIELDGEAWWVVNRFCHKCRISSLGGPLKWGRKGETVRFVCVYCNSKEWRKVYRNPVK